MYEGIQGMPAVSYLVSSYNKAPYIESVIVSILKEWATTGGEIIVIDDGSTDDSMQILSKLQKRSPQIQVVSQKNQGVFSTTWSLIGQASCEWIRLVDSDDPIIEGSTLTLFRASKATGADYIYGRMLDYTPDDTLAGDVLNQVTNPKSWRITDPLRYLLISFNHVPSATLFRRQAVAFDFSWPPDLISCQDLALALPIFQSRTVAFVDILVCRRLVGVKNRLSYNEALTRHQTICIIQAFGREQFTPKLKKLALYKLTSRSARWARRNGKWGLFATLGLRKLMIQMGLALNWDEGLNAAARVFEPAVAHVIALRRPY